jgi:tight adherence protein B
VTRKRLVVPLFLLLVVLMGGAAAAESPSRVQIRDVDTSAYPTVGVTVAVSGEVNPSSIAITENGTESTLITARPLYQTGKGIDVVLAIDTSNSVAGAPLQQAVSAAQQFVSSTPSGVAVGILTFSDQPRVLLPITIDHQAVLSALASLSQTHPGTRLYDAVAAAAAMFSGSAQHNIVLLTDGADVRSRLSVDEAVVAASRVPAIIFSVGLNGSQPAFQGLAQLADGTGGTFQDATSADLAALYQDLARQLSRQYLVLYRSRGPGGAQITVGVETPVGAARSLVLMPRASGVPSSGDRTLLFGPWGLAIVLVLSFLTAFALATMIFGSRFRVRRDKELALRMSAPSWAQEELHRREEGPASWVPGTLVQFGEVIAEAGGFKVSLERRLERAGLPVTSGEVIGGAAVTFSLGAVAGGLLFRSLLLALILGLIAGDVPFFVIKRKLNKRLDLLQSQLPDVLMILASSMRAGHSFQQALDTVAKEIGDPGGPEFARVVAEIRLGRPFDEALNALAERVGTEEFKWAVLGVNVQREVGGNLAEILDTLSETVRERDAIRRQVRVLSAEGRLSVKILLFMPFFLAGYLVLVNRDYMELLWTTKWGVVSMVAGGVLMLVGAIWAKRTVKIDV